MSEILFRAWHKKEGKMYYRAYQKLLHVLLCVEDAGKNEGRGVPVGRAPYEECELMQYSTVHDRNGKEIFEGDFVRIRLGGKFYEGVVDGVPDMFKSKKLHPLHNLLQIHGIRDDELGMEFEVLGNRFENPVMCGLKEPK